MFAIQEPMSTSSTREHLRCALSALNNDNGKVHYRLLHKTLLECEGCKVGGKCYKPSKTLMAAFWSVSQGFLARLLHTHMHEHVLPQCASAQGLTVCICSQFTSNYLKEYDFESHKDAEISGKLETWEAFLCTVVRRWVDACRGLLATALVIKQ